MEYGNKDNIGRDQIVRYEIYKAKTIKSFFRLTKQPESMSGNLSLSNSPARCI